MSDSSQESKAKRILETYIREKYKMFLDTGSLLAHEADLFWEHVTPAVKEVNNKIIIPKLVIDEIEKLANSPESILETAERARNAIKMINTLLAENVLEIRGEASDNSVEGVFRAVFTKFRTKYNMLLVTQDSNLGKEIIELNSTESDSATPVHVRKINRYGFLSKFNWDNSGGIKNEQTTNRGFSITKFPDEVINVESLPSIGETVFSDEGSYILKDKLSSAGGEGELYTTDSSYVVKIYKKGKATIRKNEKIKRIIEKTKDMQSRGIQIEGVCFPKAIITNENGEFLGFLMEKAQGKELATSLFSHIYIQKFFSEWTKKETVQLCLTILHKIEALHKEGFVIGDINPRNILVQSPEEVYFVDVDSYQVEGFPCPVGTVLYSPPEILAEEKEYGDFLRTIGNENFAVATLLFMIMLPGKPPYAQQGGEDQKDNIIKMDFSYPLGENSNKKTPAGRWRFAWSHLPFSLKNAFYHTFRADGKYSTEGKRLKTEDWIRLFREYARMLESGELKQQDPMAEELFPTRLKLHPNVQYEVCSVCGQKIPVNQLRGGACNTCLHRRGEVYQCARCHKDILYSNFDKYILKKPRKLYCSECAAYFSQVKLTVRCKMCGEWFKITVGEYENYRSKGLSIPKRCRECRKQRRMR